MFLLGGDVVLSATDLTNATDCEWAVLRRLDARLGRVVAEPDPADALRDRAARLGDAHEERQLEAYRQQPGTVVAEIARPDDSRDPDALRAAQQRTLDAMAGGADVVFQATLFDGRFLGFADFLVRTGEQWEVYDTKLARRAKVTALMQLAAYAGQLQALGVPVGDRVHLLLGDGTTSSHRLADVQPVYAERMDRLRALVDERVAAAEPLAWGAPGIAACGRCAECTAQVQASRDVLLVGRLTVRQRDRLAAAGITTIDAFAASSGPIDGIGATPLQRLRLQARLQLRAEADGGIRSQVIDPSGLAALPAPDAGDVFFDFEGDPLWSDDGRTWGLEYLFGVVEPDGAFRPFWAHDREQEKLALLDFLEYVTARRRAHPGMHVYHYADYERSHLQQLCARHGVGEAMLDELLRDHVLVDLYPIVLRSIRISERSYSLKRLEPLYMGERLRESDVTDGAASVSAYVTWCRLVEQGDTDRAALQLREIADYNEYDCASTQGLRDWLLGLADEHDVARRPAPPDEPQTDAAMARREDEVRNALLARIADVPRADRTPEQTAIALAAAAIEFHRREDRTFWWEHYDREIAPLDDWADQKDVLVADTARVLQDWRPGERRGAPASRVLELTGALAAGSGLKAGDDGVHVMYDDPAPAGCDPVPAGQRGEHARTAVREVRLLADGRSAVVLEERAGGWNDDVEPWAALPIAITPKPPMWTRNQRAAILEWGSRLVHGFPAGDPVVDLLQRRPPRLVGGAAITSPAEPTAGAITADVLRLDRSYLAVQGPPGSGKTHVGAHVIASLVRDHGWRVGVVAQSHAVVENLLDRVVDAGLPADLVGKRISKAGTVGAWSVIEPDRPVGVPLWTGARRDGFVLGGTAWTFTDGKQVEQKRLDLLVIDEAGQFSLANTIAVAVAAKNLLLLGDPQQLPQVSRGLHPEPVDASALGWLSEGHDVLPAALGVFLPESWRMHPRLTEEVSQLSYEGRLTSRVPQTTARRLRGVEPGLHPVPVEHSGDTVESIAEAEAVLRVVADVLGTPWTDPSADRVDDPLDEQDVIVVAPFNAQVARIRAVLDDAGHRRVRVGTADRFQGQEAVVAIVSLTASSPADVPRGIGFVLSRNRINVAISRAQWASYLVHSPALAGALPHDAEGVAELAGFLRLTRA